ncbi:hypothetical protein OESDEN_11454 [Oesophagostomum dentatum]|uniref:Uncharacterized protein n=1 Tax=Oesophagostomum dentatum TaxID=61180 RepID=A0A0B1SUX2_OESDE|nr:hypothetical protein OESDEN_11454 [Oesophagostomum dentatum]
MASDFMTSYRVKWIQMHGKNTKNEYRASICYDTPASYEDERNEKKWRVRYCLYQQWISEILWLVRAEDAKILDYTEPLYFGAL